LNRAAAREIKCPADCRVLPITTKLQGAVFMSNERTAVMTRPQQSVVAAHQPSQPELMKTIAGVETLATMVAE
jgi:hypothetical protein